MSLQHVTAAPAPTRRRCGSEATALSVQHGSDTIDLTGRSEKCNANFQAKFFFAGRRDFRTIRGGSCKKTVMSADGRPQKADQLYFVHEVCKLGLKTRIEDPRRAGIIDCKGRRGVAGPGPIRSDKQPVCNQLHIGGLR